VAITKLMNIKTSSYGAGRHLYNSIQYILNPEKTKGGLLVGGNTGAVCDEVYEVMMETKRVWDKMDGRQGYHFVISWKPGEIEEENAVQIIKEFCEEYLGEEYDYVFSVHDDHAHMHGHIVFNSVRRTDGYKYRYIKGDWEKFIQPITDKVCMSHGLPKLEYGSNRKGKSYGEWYSEKNGKTTGIKIIKADIDSAITRSDSYSSFLSVMGKFGYKIEPRLIGGVPELALTAPGQERARRTNKLGAGYRLKDIKERIGKVKFRIEAPKLPAVKSCTMKFTVKKLPQASRYQVRKVREIYKVQTFYTRKNPFLVNQSNIRKNMRQIEKLTGDCRYLLRMKIKNESELTQREELLKKEERTLKNQRSALISAAHVLEDDKEYAEYLKLQQELQEISEWDDRFEDVQDALEALEEKLPLGEETIEADTTKIKDQLESIRKEKNIIRRIKKRDGELQIIERQERINILPTAEQIMEKARGEKKWQKIQTQKKSDQKKG